MTYLIRTFRSGLALIFFFCGIACLLTAVSLGNVLPNDQYILLVPAVTLILLILVPALAFTVPKENNRFTITENGVSGRFSSFPHIKTAYREIPWSAIGYHRMISSKYIEVFLLSLQNDKEYTIRTTVFLSRHKDLAAFLIAFEDAWNVYQSKK